MSVSVAVQGGRIASEIDVIGGATSSSQAFRGAVQQALQQAQA